MRERKYTENQGSIGFSEKVWRRGNRIITEWCKNKKVIGMKDKRGSLNLAMELPAMLKNEVLKEK